MVFGAPGYGERIAARRLQQGGTFLRVAEVPADATPEAVAGCPAGRPVGRPHPDHRGHHPTRCSQAAADFAHVVEQGGSQDGAFGASESPVDPAGHGHRVATVCSRH